MWTCRTKHANLHAASNRELLASVAKVLRILQRIPCSNAARQLDSAYQLLGDCFTLRTHAAFACPRSEQHQKPNTRQHLQLFASLGCDLSQQLSSVLHDFLYTQGQAYTAAQAVSSRHMELASALLVDAAFEGCWLSPDARNRWQRELQTAVMEHDALFGQLWSQAVAMLQVCPQTVTCAATRSSYKRSNAVRDGVNAS